MTDKFHSPRVANAAELVAVAHKGQFRKDGKTPFITHPLEVMRIVEQYVGTDEVSLISALAHDCVEDIEDFDIDAFLNELYGENSQYKNEKSRIKEIVLSLTKNNTVAGRHDRDVDTYKRIDLAGSQLIKLCDRYHNVSDMEGMTDPFKRRYIAETYFMLGYFMNMSTHNIYKDLLKLTEKRAGELFSCSK